MITTPIRPRPNNFWIKQKQMATLSIRKSYKFRLYPNQDQTARLESSLDLCRYLYNAAVQERRDAWRLNHVNVSFFDQSKQITEIRANDPDYMGVQSRVLRQTLRQVDKAFQAFFRRVKSGDVPGYPRFKGKSFFHSFFYNCVGFKFIGTKLRLANIGLVKIRQHREMEGTVKEIVVKREGSKWYAIVSCDNVSATQLSAANQNIGIDVGIESFATLSDGTHIDNWKYYESSAKRLRVAQRSVARRKKGSHRRRKAIECLRKIHQKISNQRTDFQHKVSTDLVRDYDLIAIEKLNIVGLAKSRLSKQILDVSWGSFFQKLKYKAENAGRQLIEVDPRGTSQTCICGAEVRKDLSVRWHNCVACGHSEHRDVVSAKVILQRAGLVLKDITWAVAPSVSLEVV